METGEEYGKRLHLADWGWPQTFSCLLHWHARSEIPDSSRGEGYMAEPIHLDAPERPHSMERPRLLGPV